MHTKFSRAKHAAKRTSGSARTTKEARNKSAIAKRVLRGTQNGGCMASFICRSELSIFFQSVVLPQHKTDTRQRSLLQDKNTICFTNEDTKIDGFNIEGHCSSPRVYSEAFFGF